MYIFCVINIAIFIHFKSDLLIPFQGIIRVQDYVSFPRQQQVLFFLYSTISTGKFLLSPEQNGICTHPIPATSYYYFSLSWAFSFGNRKEISQQLKGRESPYLLKWSGWLLAATTDQLFCLSLERLFWYGGRNYLPDFRAATSGFPLIAAEARDKSKNG